MWSSIMKKLLVIMMVVALSACSGEKETIVEGGLNEAYVEEKEEAEIIKKLESAS